MNKPEKIFRAGAITAAVWRNEVEKDGDKVSYPTVTFERRYTDKDGNWQTTNSLRLTDLPKAKLVLSKAYEYLAITEAEV